MLSSDSQEEMIWVSQDLESYFGFPDLNTLIKNDS